MATHKCMFCKNKYSDKKTLYGHIEKYHSDLVSEDVTIPQLCFNYRNKKTVGTCTICGSDTTWNEKSERYNSFCSERCKDIYAKEAKARMVKKYGKEHILDSSNHQRKMLKGRSISGTYTWSNNQTKTDYTGTYELDFLKFMDMFMEWNPLDLIECPHTIDYEYENEKKFYIPDFFIPSLNTIIEIKDGGDNPNNHHKIQNVDKVKERLKDKAIIDMKRFNYIKVSDKNYAGFIKFLLDLKESDYVGEQKSSSFKPIYTIGESVELMVENILEEVIY